MKSVKFSRTCGMLLIGISHLLTYQWGGVLGRDPMGKGGGGIVRHQQSTKGGLENFR